MYYNFVTASLEDRKGNGKIRKLHVFDFFDSLHFPQNSKIRNHEILLDMYLLNPMQLKM